MSYTNMPDVVLAKATVDLDTVATVITFISSRKCFITGLGITVTDTVAGSPAIELKRGGTTKTFSPPANTDAHYLRFEPIEVRPNQATTVKVTTGATASSGDGTVFELFGRIHPVEDNFTGHSVVNL